MLPENTDLYLKTLPGLSHYIISTDHGVKKEERLFVFVRSSLVLWTKERMLFSEAYSVAS